METQMQGSPSPSSARASKKSPTDGEAGDGAGLQGGVGNGGQRNGHEAAVDAGGDRELFALMAGLKVSLGKQSVVQERGGLGGDGFKELVVDGAEVAGGEETVQIEQAEEFAGAVGRAGFAQGNAVDAADVVQDDAGPFGRVGVGAGVGDGEAKAALNGLGDGAAGDAGILFKQDLAGVETASHAHRAVLSGLILAGLADKDRSRVRGR